MDPERVRGYLQVACAGLGFDIGEIWWTSNESGTSTLATIEEKKDEKGSNEKKLRFVQLYTSKSYADRRSMLVSPDSPDKQDTESTALAKKEQPCTASQLEKHVLSPQLVNAISSSAQVVWANCQKQEGLLGRSDMRLQTAVGMPVAIDSEGNMCVVVMFSPENLESTDDAMEYLQFISKSATSSSIPCLLPVFDDGTMRPALTSHAHHHHSSDPSLGEGVTAHYVFMDEHGDATHGDHDLASAPKDCFGIPMLPSFAEFGSSSTEDAKPPAQTPSPLCDPFDEASFGVWATIMHNTNDVASSNGNESDEGQKPPAKETVDANGIPHFEPLVTQPVMPFHRRERLEEFCSAFLEMSVFDMSDVFMPVPGQDVLGHVTSIVSTDKNPALNEFTLVSQYAQIKLWSGAVGRAYASGNPVWSANFDVIVDSARSAAFEKAKIHTALAVPIFSSGAVSPACVVCCYSLVRAEAVPTVLRFVQQALRLLWTGLDKVEPHQSIGKERWRDVAPADLGEMAADIEMQHSFVKKRRFSLISPPASPPQAEDSDDNLSGQLKSLELVRPEPLPPQQYLDATSQKADAVTSSLAETPQALLPSHPETFSLIQEHLQDAVRSIGDAVPYSNHQHLATNSEGSKRAHVVGCASPVAQPTVPSPPPPPLQPTVPSTPPPQPLQPTVPSPPPVGQALRQPNPLHMPRPFPSQFPPQPASSGTAVKSSPVPISYASHANTVSSSSVPIAAAPVSSTLQPQGQATGGLALCQIAPAPANVQVLESGLVSNEQQVNVPPQNGLVVPPPSPAAPIPAAPIPAAASMPDAVKSASSQPLQNPTAAAATTKPCRIQGCDEPAVARRPYCVRHTGNRLCEHPGCTKCAQGSTRFCIAHGGGRRCTFPGCDKGARDKYFCAAHGGGKRCSHAGCTKSAVGGSNLCTSHGGGRRCAVIGCDKSAQSSTKFCVKHGGGKKCSHAGCEKVARGRTKFCAAHGGGIRCKLEGCNRVAIGKQQLCRTHGGGSRSRTVANVIAPPPFYSAPASNAGDPASLLCNEVSTPMQVSRVEGQF